MHWITSLSGKHKNTEGILFPEEKIHHAVKKQKKQKKN